MIGESKIAVKQVTRADPASVAELAKYDQDSARAWLQAKLLTALLLERLEREAFFFSPWGYPLLGPLPLA